jgi:hypothetical protein
MSFYIGLSLLSNKSLSQAGRLCPPRVEYSAGSSSGKLREIQSREGRRLLELLDGPPLTAGTLKIASGGRPYFADAHADFNIAHSNCAVALGYSGEKTTETGTLLRVGCDIEYAAPLKNREGIARKYFQPPEQQYIEAAGDDKKNGPPGDVPEKIRRFYRLWVLKECFLKMQGLSVFNMKKTPCFHLDDPVSVFDAPALSPPIGTFYLYELGDATAGLYFLALVREEGASAYERPEIRWFSEDALPLRSRTEIKAAVKPVKTVRPKI